MNRHLTRIKDLTRQIDAAVEDDVANAARSAHDIMRKFETANLVERVDAEVLGAASFDLRQWINDTMGQRLGRFIAKKIDFTSTVDPRTPSAFMRIGGTVEFRAEVYVLTREQFKAALDDAYRAGR